MAAGDRGDTGAGVREVRGMEMEMRWLSMARQAPEHRGPVGRHGRVRRVAEMATGRWSSLRKPCYPIRKKENNFFGREKMISVG